MIRHDDPAIPQRLRGLAAERVRQGGGSWIGHGLPLWFAVPMWPFWVAALFAIVVCCAVFDFHNADGEPLRCHVR